MSDISRIIDAANAGDPKAASELLPLVYDELRKLAASKLSKEPAGQTLNATALVHEAYVRLVGPKGDSIWDNRGHFFAAAAEAMRRILVEAARRKKRVKHGGEFERLEVDLSQITVETPADELLSIDQSLDRLAEHDPDAAKVVKLRYFVGLSINDAAEALGISRASAYRQWTFALAWLQCDMQNDLPSN